MTGRVEDKVAVVTGSGSGIGRETALLLAHEGAKVALIDVDEEAAQQTAATITARGGQSVAFGADVSSEPAVAAAMQGVADLWGRLDILHNNAYWAPRDKPVVETSHEEWQRALAVSLTGVFLGCKHGIPLMARAGGGSIVNTASTAALTALPRFAAYTAAKGGVVALTRSVALDYAHQRIRCNAVCPGLVETPATQGLLADPSTRAMYERKQLLGRFGVPRDIATAVLYLASDEASYVTGQSLVVDGGRLIA